MTTTWFLCPYDVVKDPNLMRVCSMHRYIPYIPNKDGNVWEEVEIRGNYTMVKVSATDSILTVIRADPDFTEILAKEPLTPETVNVFKTLGYAPEELPTTTVEDLLRAVCATRSVVTANVTADDVIIGAPQVNTVKSFDSIDVKVTGAAVP